MPDAALRQGQIARLLMQHRATLYGYIFACVRNHADAEDILQNVSVAVTESIDRLTSEAGFLPSGARDRPAARLGSSPGRPP